jgi:NAD(P)-dependent dehydrogenase (short-subunit alcohol dehydrogenase family)
LASISDKTLGSSHKALAKSVLIKPGHNALTVIFLGPHSAAKDLTSPRSAVLGAYSISKTADLGLVRSLAAEWGPKNITVNALCPGLIKTDFARALWEDPKVLSEIEANAPLRRIGIPDEVAGAAVLLASDAGAFITGQKIVMDGGVTITS